MSCEDIGEPEFASEFAIGYLRSVLPEPRGCGLESESAEHELGSYPVIRLCADPSFGWDNPPMEYVCAYQDLLSRFELAIDWSLITDVLAAEDEGSGADKSIPPHGPALIRTSDAPGGELEPEWRRFLQRFPDAVEWEKIEPSAVAELIRRHLEPEESPLDGLSRMGRLYAESLRNNAPGAWEELEANGELAETLARNDQEIQQSFQTILAHNKKNHGLDPNDPLYADRLKVLAGMAREQTMDCWLVKDAETMEAELDGFVDPPEDEDDEEDEEDEEPEEDDADLTLDRVERDMKHGPGGTRTTSQPDSSKKGVLVAGMPLDEYLKRSDRMMSDHWPPSPDPFPKQANSEKRGDALGNAEIPLPENGTGRINWLRSALLLAAFLWLAAADIVLWDRLLPDDGVPGVIAMFGGLLGFFALMALFSNPRIERWIGAGRDETSMHLGIREPSREDRIRRNTPGSVFVALVLGLWLLEYVWGFIDWIR